MVTFFSTLKYFKMKKLLIIFILSIFSCQPQKKISNDEVVEAFEAFFEALDNDLVHFETLVTDDFFIFENSRHYTKDEFIEFVTTFDIISAKRKFEDLSIDTDYNSAHISLKHQGEFIVNTPDGKVKLEFEWLESTYAVKINNKLKFKFYFSQAIKENSSIILAE